jgi:alanyl-tRNA synthetase
MQSREIRQSFLDYFRKNGHEPVRSSPLVPQNDPTLLFTNAGMVQFKDVFTGRETRPYKRATSSQKCVRAGGKHNDLENVGRTARHHTFFEMLGNFSFGDYFKEDAIAFAWEWLTRELGLDRNKLVITVFGGDAALGLGPDDEARAIWRRVTGFSDERIFGLGMKDNFWMMGDTGPQGPCSEIYYAFGDAELAHFGEEPTPDGRGWTEIWNLVFMQFERAEKGGSLAPLPRPSIDTGAGLERVTCVVEGVTSNYDTDLLRPLVERVSEAAKKKYGATQGDDDVSMRVLADHARATAFLMADGVAPSNEGRGYVLRRIMRRAIRHGVRLGLHEGAFAQLCAQVVAAMSPVFPELGDAKSLIARAVDAEDGAFRRTIDRGMKLLDETMQVTSGKSLPGEIVFKLYDTYGFPVDLTRVIAEERGFAVDEAGFEAAMEEQRARSAEFAGSGEAAVGDLYKSLRAELGATEFLGYQTTEAVDHVAALLVKGRRVESAATGEHVEIVARTTPFYGESGGQIGDTGRIHAASFEIAVENTLKPGGDLIVHQGVVKSGTVGVNASATFTVDAERRDAIRANHSATHLLHWALRHVLGEHVTQKGSLVAPDRLRFDFAHFTPMTVEEKRRVEELVNAEVLRNQDTQVTVTGFDEARALGAMALFGEKYGERVRVLQIGAHSVELCGGTHVRRAGDIGQFKITAEIGIAQGIRRIEAVTGSGALAYTQRLEEELARAAERTRAPLFKVSESIEKLQRDLKERDKKIEELQRKMAMGGGGRDVMSSVREIAGVKVLATRSEVGDPKALREVADQLRGKLGSGVVVLGGVSDGKVALVAAVTPDLTARFNAGKIVGAVSSAVGGKGGGRPDLAQGGGPNADKLDEALESVYSLIA